MSTVVIFFISPSPSRCWQSPVWGSLESHFGVVASGVWCQDSDQIGATDQMGHPQYCRLGRLFIISPCQSWVERFGAKYFIINIRSQVNVSAVIVITTFHQERLRHHILLLESPCQLVSHVFCPLKCARLPI